MIYSVDPDDLKAVVDAIHEVLKAEGYDTYVAEAKVVAMATYAIQKLDFARAQRKRKKTTT